MSGANTFKFVMLPPQSDVTRDWGRALAEAMPEVRVVIAEDQAALCAGPEAVAWRNMAEAWREAARKAGASRYEQTLHVLIRHDAAGNGRPD